MSKPFGRSLSDFASLTAPEVALVRHCRFGTQLHFGARRPKSAAFPYTLRAELVRFLALGGDEHAPVHENGLDITGAWIEGQLNLEGVSVTTSLSFKHCHFTKEVILRGASLSGSLELNGSYVPGIRGDGMTCRGDLFLREQFSSAGVIRFVGASIDGDVDLSDAYLRGGPAGALAFEGAMVKGALYFRGTFHAVGSVRLTGMRVAHDVECDGAQFDGWQHARAAPDVALSLQRAHVDGALIVRGTRLSNVSLADAHVRYLKDDLQSWGESVTLDGFVYDSISHQAPTRWEDRLAWLRRQRPQHLGESDPSMFCPQPWQQLIRTLHAAGHKEDAIEIGVAFEDHLRKIGKIGAASNGISAFRAVPYRWVSHVGHWLFGIFAGYGYRPMRLITWMFSVWFGCAVLYWAAALQGVFGPSNPLIFENATYAQCASTSSQTTRNWYLCPPLKSEYSTLSPLAFSLDVLLPVVNLRQEDSWAPLVQTPEEAVWGEFWNWKWGHATRFLIWLENIFGWASSLLLVATVSGFARRIE